MDHTGEITQFLRNGDFEATEEGLLIHQSILARGRYYHTVNGKDERIEPNLIVAEGILYMLEASMNNGTQLTNWYLAPYGGNVSPAAGWTAANFAANSTEITSLTDGYTEATRQAWTPGAAAAGKIGNLSSRAVFTIATTGSPLNIYGAGLLSDSTRGGTSGTLVSATKYAAVRVVNDGDSYELGYEVELTDS